MMKQFLQSAAALFLLGTVLAGCSREEMPEGPVPTADEARIQFEVALPDVSTPATRGIQVENEAAVDNFYVLIFDKDDKFVDKKIITSGITTASGSGSTAKEIKSFTTALPKSKSETDLYRVALLANVTGDLATAVNAIQKDDDRETVLAALTQTYSGNPAKPFPMASIPTAAVKIVEGMAAQSFDMIRMVARIDVTLDTDVASDYSVKRVLFYNYNTVGRVWTSTYSGTTVTGVTLPGDPKTSAAGSKYAVDNLRTDNKAATNFNAMLYACEATVGAVEARPCIVIELEDKTGTSVGHYRADFLSSSGNPRYLNILRNHRYLFNITAVHGTGFTDPDVAYNSTPVGLEMSVIDWNEADMKEIVVSGNYWLTLSARDLTLDYTAQTNTSIKVQTNVQSGWEVEGIYANADGTGTVDWLTKAEKSGGNLAVTVTKNTSFARTAYVGLTAGTLKFTLSVTQEIGLPEMPDISNAGTFRMNSYVGAFWQAEQTGERLIKIKVSSDEESDKEWAIQVYEYGDDFVEGDIVFSKVGSYDPYIYTENAIDMNTYDAYYRVQGDSTYAMGYAQDGEYIFFRIGLKSKWNASNSRYDSSKPARYATLLLTYGGYKYHHKIYLRQGHEPDYLMYPGDEDKSGEFTRTVTNTRKFSPYNLTAAGLNDTDVPLVQMTNAREGVFVDYPTKAGAFFQFAAPEPHQRIAFHPTRIAAFPYYDRYDETDFDAAQETCPPGYRRPLASLIDNKDESELHPSLRIAADFFYEDINSIFGYYADGYFDRRNLESSFNSNKNTTVSSGTKEVAYMGHLIFNPLPNSERYNASLFLPSAGRIWVNDYSESKIASTGKTGVYWSSTEDGQELSKWARYLALYKSSYPGDSLSPNCNTERSIGMSIRCVVE